MVSGNAGAQMVGDNIFLKGKYIEIGVAPNGGYGSTLSAPVGYHPNLGTSFTFYDPAAGTASTSSTLLGFVADYGEDGWTVGAPPFFGDYYMPGTPQEGWALQEGTAESDAYIPAYLSVPTTGYTGTLEGTNVVYINSGGISKGVWQGTSGALSIRQTTTLDTSKLYFTVNVVIKNTAATATGNLYYLRTVDPDNEEVTVGPIGFTTINTITYQLPNPDNKVLVSATGVTYTNAYLGLGTKDCRAKCMIYDFGLAPEFSLDQMWAETGTTYMYTQGTVYTQDVGIGLEFNLGSLAAGDSTSLTYAYILNAADIDSALNATQPQFVVNSVALADTVDTINLCMYAPDSVLVSVKNGDFYHWAITPDSFVVDTEGIPMVIHSDSLRSTVTYTLTGTNNAGGCNTVRYYLTLEHGHSAGPVIAPTSLCQDAPSAPLTAPGTGITWWPGPTGGVGSSTPPTPNTSIPGTYVYWVTQQVGLCTSDRAPDTVNIIPLPLPPSLSGVTPYCQGAAFVPFSVTGSNVLWYTVATGGIGSVTAPTVNTGVPGSYTYYASQTVNGCEGPRQAITTTVLDSIIPSFTYDVHLGCHGDTVIFHNTSVNADHYVWYMGDGAVDTNASPVHIYLSQGTYNVALFGKNGACVDSTSQNIILSHPLHAAFSNTPGVACQYSLFTFTNGSSGTGVSYVWSFGNGATTTATDPTYVYPNSGTYQVQLVATDFVPCSDTATTTIYVDTLSGINIGLSDSVLCGGTYVTLTGLFASLGNTGVTWDFGDGTTIKNVNPVYHTFAGGQTYTVTVTADYRACPTVTATRSVSVIAQPVVSLGADTSICPGSEALVLTDNLNSAVPGATWLWSTGETSPSITVVSPGYYYVTVNVGNCYSADTVWVKNDCYMNIPNVFSPNSDGVNDYFFPRQMLTKGLTKFSMAIYNRWGETVFQSSSLDGRGWDGNFNGVQQPEGVYVYVIDATFRDGQHEHHQGNVTLIR